MDNPRHTGRLRLGAVVPVALLLLAACSEPSIDRWRRELAGAEARWRSAAVSDYEMDVVMTCICVPAQIQPVTATVRGGAFVSLVYSDSGGARADTTLFRNFMTMDRIFTAMHDVVDAEPHSLYAEYNPAYGFPTIWRVDPDRLTTDDEFTFQVLGFRRLTVAAR